MLEFREVQQELLEELLRRAGLGDLTDDLKCALCQMKLDPHATALLPVVPPVCGSVSLCIQ